MTTNAVFTDDKGKYATAVYRCEISGPREQVTPEWVTQLWPRAYGHSITAFNYTPLTWCTRWYFLISNERQTTRADVVNRLKKAGIHPDHIGVVVMAAIPGHGSALRTGTSRTGTTRTLPNAAHGVGLVAK